MMAEIFELLKQRSAQLSSKSLAAVGMALRSGEAGTVFETCPHCGGLLRIRKSLHPETLKTVNGWPVKQRSGQ